MSDTTASPADEPADSTPADRVDFSKEQRVPAGYSAPETTDTELLSTEIRVLVGTAARIFDFRADQNVSYYTGLAGAKVGFGRGRTATIDNVRVGGGHKITQGGITIVVNRKPRNG